MGSAHDAGRSPTVGMRFRETMEGTWRPAGAGADGGGGEQPMRLDLDASLPGVVSVRGTVTGTLTGTVSAGGLADAAPATGTLEVSPLEHRRVRYSLTFEAGGRPLRFDGWKSLRWRRPVATWTTLPGTVYDREGEVVGTALLRFPLGDLGRFVASMRPVLAGVPTESVAASVLEERRWAGERGRLEVWYDTVTDAHTGTGLWLHHELVAPTSGRAGEAGEAGEVHGTGWVAVFAPGEPPRWERFGPAPIGSGAAFAAGDVVAEPGVRRGRAGDIRWDLTYEAGASPPLYTFPAAAWHGQLLPAAQIVPAPHAAYSGTVQIGDRRLELDGAIGAAARIYGHGNAARWAWLHADLGGGDVLEVVAAVPHRPGLDHLPALPLVQLRVDGEDWPAHPLLAAARFRCRPRLPAWALSGGVGDRRLRVAVALPPDRCVTIPYRDPDGSTATCTNSERANAAIMVQRRLGRRWEVERSWVLRGTAHAEVGVRP